MRTTWLPVLGLLVVSPVGAEYLLGYDTTTGDPLALVAGLLVLAPLYGAPALLIREVARRRGRGWPSLLLLAAAAGLVQAGIVDQSMFSESYRDIPSWPQITEPTWIGPLGLSVYATLTFVGGHVALSFGAPIALVEALTPARRTRPWLGRRGAALLAVLYVLACLLVLVDHLTLESDHASLPQLVGAAAVAGALVVTALRLPVAEGPRTRPVAGGRVPRPGLVGVVSGTAMLAFLGLPPSPAGTTALVAVGLLLVVGCGVLSRRPGWGHSHILAVAAGGLVGAALFGFAVTPLGEVARGARLGHHVVLLLGLALLVGLAARPRSSAPVPDVG